MRTTVTAALIAALGSLAYACGSSAGPEPEPQADASQPHHAIEHDAGGQPAGRAGTGGAGAAMLPVHDDLTLIFSPMYSAFDGTHPFQVPAIVQGISQADWSARPSEAVDLERDSSTGGVIITVRKAGDCEIIARAGALSGSAMLHVTASTPELWSLGETLYTSGGLFRRDALVAAGLVIPSGLDLPERASCRDCHGSGARALDVEYTPQQAAGYSDEQLVNIITNGIKPAGEQFHTGIPASFFPIFHSWNATGDQRAGLVTYLRSLAPRTQGSLDFQRPRSGVDAGVPSPIDAAVIAQPDAAAGVTAAQCVATTTPKADSVPPPCVSCLCGKNPAAVSKVSVDGWNLFECIRASGCSNTDTPCIVSNCSPAVTLGVADLQPVSLVVSMCQLECLSDDLDAGR